jgi:hypothetical protein
LHRCKALEVVTALTVGDFHAIAFTPVKSEMLVTPYWARHRVRPNDQDQSLRKRMAATEGDQRPVSMMATWRTPPVIVVCGFLVGMLTLGPRSTVARPVAQPA